MIKIKRDRLTEKRGAVYNSLFKFVHAAINTWYDTYIFTHLRTCNS